MRAKEIAAGMLFTLGFVMSCVAVGSFENGGSAIGLLIESAFTIIFWVAAFGVGKDVEFDEEE